jgi:hypothetical protein
MAAARMDEGVLDRDQATARRGADAVVFDDRVGDLSVRLRLARPHGRHDDTVAQREAADRERRQQVRHGVAEDSTVSPLGASLNP